MMCSGELVCSLTGVLVHQTAFAAAMKALVQSESTGASDLNMDRVQEVDLLDEGNERGLLVSSAGCAGSYANDYHNHPSIKKPNVRMALHPSLVSQHLN